MPESRLITVVVPAMNEEENVEPFFAAASAVVRDLCQFEWEFIFVDDGSTDRTLDRVLALRETDSRVRVLQLSRNFGSYAAIRAGFDYARGDAVITMSADLQDPPHLFLSFVERWLDGCHVVWGIRVQRDDPWSKKILASLFYRLIRRLALPNLPTEGMDCGLFDRKVIHAFRQIPDTNIITFITIYWMGFRQARVPYHRQRRLRGKSKWPLDKRVKAALDVVTAFSYLPIRFASYLGFAVSGVSVLGAVVILFMKAAWGIGSVGWPWMMLSIFFLGGVQLLTLGIIGEYLWRISAAVRGQPNYIVMQELGFGEGEIEQKVPGPPLSVIGK